MKKKNGFTLIELILVLGLLTTMGALAAPQFTAVFDNSKDQADIAQMDSLLAAFQWEQAPFYDEHENVYDLLKAENLHPVKDEKGNIVGSEVVPEKAVQTLQAFLDAVADPTSSVYMEEVACLTTAKIHGKAGSIFRARLENDQTLKIVCEADGNESSVQLFIPKTDMITYAYSEDEPEEGTWLIIGDDDRLRAEYVQALMHMGKEEARKAYLKKDKGNTYYRYRTSFIIDHREKDAAQTDGGDYWKLFTHLQNGGTQEIGLDPDALINGKVKYRYRYYQGHKWRGAPYEYEELNQLESLNVAMGHTMNEAIVEFEDWDGTAYAKYGIRVIQKKDMPGIPNPAENDQNSGWIQTGKNHWFYYELMAGDDNGSGSSSGNDKEDGFSYHTGMVFNYVNENNYDFLSLEENQSGRMALRSYRIQGGSASGFKTEKELNGFQFNQSYTMDLRVEKGKVIVNLSNNLLEPDAEFAVGYDLHPAIGYYMGEEADLEGRAAVSDYNQESPLVVYKQGEGQGPRLILASVPEFYPYENETPAPQPPEGLGSPMIECLGVSTLTINPVEFRVSVEPKTKGTMIVHLPDGSVHRSASHTEVFSVSQAGWIEAYVEKNGDKSQTNRKYVDNIIPPFSEIDGSYTQGRWSTDFDFINYREIVEEMDTYQPREILRLIFETKGRKYEVSDSRFSIWNNELDINDLAVYVESEHGEVLSPKAEIERPQPPEIHLDSSDYFGYATITLTAQGENKILYRFLDEEEKPVGNWTAYWRPFEESFAFIEARSENSAGDQSESVIQKNPYHDALIPTPTITPLENGNIQVTSAPGTTIWYRDGRSWYNSYRDGWIVSLEQGETLEVYAKSMFGDNKSEVASYTKDSQPLVQPSAPVIEKPFFNRDTIWISAEDYDLIWYRYEFQQNWKKTKWSNLESSAVDVELVDSRIIRIEAYAEKDGEISETVVWSK